MENETKLNSQSPNEGNEQAKDAQSNVQDPESFKDPISTEKNNESADEIADNEQKFKEALTERD